MALILRRRRPTARLTYLLICMGHWSYSIILFWLHLAPVLQLHGWAYSYSTASVAETATGNGNMSAPTWLDSKQFRDDISCCLSYAGAAWSVGIGSRTVPVACLCWTEDPGITVTWTNRWLHSHGTDLLSSTRHYLVYLNFESNLKISHVMAGLISRSFLTRATRLAARWMPLLHGQLRKPVHSTREWNVYRTSVAPTCRWSR